METGNEIKGFNIAEALKYAPKGLKLYSPLFGEVEFDFLDDNNDIHISFKEAFDAEYFDLNGKYFKSYSNAECLLFPSTHCRTWNHWQNTLFPKSIGSVCVDSIGYKFILENNGTFFSDGPGSGYSVIIEDDESNFFLNSRYATPEETKEFFEELDKNGYMWNGETVVKVMGKIKPKFKVGDIVKFDRPSATVKREILSIDFENERYLTRRTDIGGAIKEFIYFCEQDDYVIVGSHNSLSNLSIDVKISILTDEILALKERVKALEIQEIKQCSDKNTLDSLESKMIILDSYNINERLDMIEMKLSALEKLAKDSEIKIDALECGGKPFQCPDKAGDNVTLKDMKS